VLAWPSSGMAATSAAEWCGCGRNAFDDLGEFGKCGWPDQAVYLGLDLTSSTASVSISGVHPLQAAGTACSPWLASLDCISFIAWALSIW